MPQVQLGKLCFVDNVRLSSYASEIVDATGERQALQGHTVEDNRTFDIPGKFNDSPITWQGYLPQSLDQGRLLELNEAGNELIWSEVAAKTVGSISRVSKGYMMDHSWGAVDRYTFGGSLSVSDPYHSTLGALRYFNTSVTGADNGTAFQLAGGLAAGEGISVNVHPINKTAGVATLDCKFQSSVDQAFTTPVDEITFTQMNASNGGVALRGNAQRGTLDGDTAAITNTWFRFSVTAVSAQTWGLAVTVSKYTKR